MARVRIRLKNLGELNKIIAKRVESVVKNKETGKQITKIVTDGVKERRISVKSKATLAWRRYFEKGNKTDSKYNRDRINFTFTGDLMRDLINNVKYKSGKSRGVYTIEQSKSLHKKMKKPDGTPVKGSAKSYKQINTYLNKLGYFYLHKVNKKNTKRIVRYLRREILRRFK